MSYNKDTGMYEGYIYKILNDVNDKVYIGQTRRTVEVRFKNHLSDAKNHPELTIFHTAMNQIGVQHFHFKIIEILNGKTIEDIENILDDREIYWIAYYKSQNIELYNMTIGGDNAGNTYPNKPVIQYDLFCNEITRFESMADASSKTNIARSDITACCLKTGKILSAGKYIWRYIDDPLTEGEINLLHQKYKGCKQYDLYGNLLNVFYTINDAVKSLQKNNLLSTSKVISGNISSCCKGKCKTAYGYVWRYCLDDFNAYETNIPNGNVLQVNLKTKEIVNIYKTPIEASRITDISYKSIISCLCGYSNFSNGYIWCYEKNYEKIKEKKYKLKEKPVDRYTLNGEYIDSYSSISKASEITGINNSCISDVCKNKRNHAGGYIWRFSGDSIDTYVNKTKRCKKINVFDLNHNLIETLDMAKDAAQKFNLNGSISTYIRNKSTYRNVILEYA